MSVTITERLCRTCMNDSNSHSLIYGELSLEDSILFEVINDVCQLEVAAGDGLPEYICRDCFIKLSEFQRFKYRAHEVNLTLQRMKERETSDIPSPEPCGSASALRDTWIKPDYSAEEHAENDGVSPHTVNQVEVSESGVEFKQESLSPERCHSTEKQVKVEPEDSYEEDSDGREGEPFEEYIGIEPDDLVYSAVGFDGQNPADATDPLQVSESGVELKQESMSPERCHSTEKDSFVVEGLKEEENVIPEALPVEVGTSWSLDATTGGEAGQVSVMQRDEEVTDFLGAVKDGGMLTHWQGDMAMHMRSHTCERPYRCDVCSKTFDCENAISLHLVIHRSEKPHVCHICGKGFLQKSSMTLHVKNHEGSLERELCCTVSSKRFTENALLEKHSKIHRDYKPFLCNVCGKGFKMVSTLKVHREMVHERTKRYFCGKCGKGFYLRSHLDIHTIRHGEERAFACDICGKTYKTSSDLRYHKITHSGLKPYACSMCSRKFTYSGNLKVHSRVHTGEKPFSCPNCGKRFTQSPSVKMHLKSCVGRQPLDSGTSRVCLNDGL